MPDDHEHHHLQDNDDCNDDHRDADNHHQDDLDIYEDRHVHDQHKDVLNQHIHNLNVYIHNLNVYELNQSHIDDEDNVDVSPLRLHVGAQLGARLVTGEEGLVLREHGVWLLVHGDHHLRRAPPRAAGLIARL